MDKTVNQKVVSASHLFSQQCVEFLNDLINGEDHYTIIHFQIIKQTDSKFTIIVLVSN